MKKDVSFRRLVALYTLETVLLSKSLSFQPCLPIMPRCSAPACRNMGSHTFPKDPVLRKKWEKATNKENFRASKHSRLCSEHFKNSDYLKVCMSTGLVPSHRYLKKTAVPSIFPKNNRDSVVSSPTPGTNVITANATPDKKIEEKTEDPDKNGSDKREPAKHKTKSTEEINLRDRSMRLRNRKAFLANRRCSVPQCNSRPSSEISLHACPNNAAVRNEWAEALRVSYHYVKNMVACSLHFMKIDFTQSKNSGRVLKHNAVPSRNLPHRKVVMPVKSRPTKKVAPCKDLERQKTMTGIEPETAENEDVKEEELRECRACLRKLDDKISCCNVFQAWAPPWEGMEPTIAEDLAKLANIEISISDRHSKVLCAPCYQKLLEAATFASHVRNSDLLLRMRFKDEIDMEKVWPKPIQVDKNINGSVYNNQMDIEIKQEVLSDEEYPANVENSYGEIELGNLDIKIEPEEFVEPPPMNITINGTVSLGPLNSENKDETNETEFNQQTQFLEMTVKQEPVSEDEQETDQIPDMPLECLLCMKSFNSVTGLKAHVIAQHSYKTVKRKCDGSVSPEKKRCDKYQCAICRRSFITSTDLMVHETCHNKHVCYGCTQKFDSFELLTRHRKKCKASINNSVQKLKTLEDVKRPLQSKTENVAQNKESETINNEVDSDKQDVKSVEESDASEVSETNQGNAANEINEASEEIEAVGNKEESEIVNEEFDNIDSKMEKKIADRENSEDTQEDSDTNMKLELEIHSTKSDIESTLDESGVQIETLQNDDCI